MSDQTINVTIDQIDIDVTIDPIEVTITSNDVTNIEVVMSSVATANFVNAGGKFFFDGSGGDTYLTYNATSKRLELWVKDTKQKEWGVVDGSPF